jgi:hypothetical protein
LEGHDLELQKSRKRIRSNEFDLRRNYNSTAQTLRASNIQSVDRQGVLTECDRHSELERCGTGEDRSATRKIKEKKYLVDSKKIAWRGELENRETSDMRMLFI